MTDEVRDVIAGAIFVAMKNDLPWERVHDESRSPWLACADVILFALREKWAIVPRADREWLPIENAPHEELLVLGWWEGDTWKQEIALASAGQRFPNGYSNRWEHGRATHYMPLYPPPAP